MRNCSVIKFLPNFEAGGWSRSTGGQKTTFWLENCPKNCRFLAELFKDSFNKQFECKIEWKLKSDWSKTIQILFKLLNSFARHVTCLFQLSSAVIFFSSLLRARTVSRAVSRAVSRTVSRTVLRTVSRIVLRTVSPDKNWLHSHAQRTSSEKDPSYNNPPHHYQHHRVIGFSNSGLLIIH